MTSTLRGASTASSTGSFVVSQSFRGTYSVTTCCRMSRTGGVRAGARCIPRLRAPTTRRCRQRRRREPLPRRSSQARDRERIAAIDGRPTRQAGARQVPGLGVHWHLRAADDPQMSCAAQPARFHRQQAGIHDESRPGWNRTGGTGRASTTSGGWRSDLMATWGASRACSTRSTLAVPAGGYFVLVFDGQLRVGLGIRQAIRDRPGRLRHSEAHPEGQRRRLQARSSRIAPSDPTLRVQAHRAARIVFRDSA